MLPGLRPTIVPNGILIHPAVWPQQTWAEIGGCVPICGGELGPHLAQSRLGRGLPHTKWHLSHQAFGHNGHWPKIEGIHAALGEGS